MNVRYFLESKHYIPDRLMEKIQQKITWMMEGGLLQFYDSLGNRLAQLREHQMLNDEDDDDEDLVSPVSIQQMQFMLSLCYLLMAFALIMFFVEITLFFIKKRANRPVTMNRPVVQRLSE